MGGQMPGQGAESFRKWIQDTDEPICRAEIEMQMERMNMWIWEVAGGKMRRLGMTDVCCHE